MIDGAAGTGGMTDTAIAGSAAAFEVGETPTEALPYSDWQGFAAPARMESCRRPQAEAGKTRLELDAL